MDQMASLPEPLSPTTTFRLLDEREGIFRSEPLPQEWPLEKWLAAVYDLPLAEFTDFDLARSCRQEMHLEAIVPLALTVLKANPYAGELYDGELLNAVMNLPIGYWEQHPAQVKQAQWIAERVFDERAGDADDPLYDEHLLRTILTFVST